MDTSLDRKAGNVSSPKSVVEVLQRHAMVQPDQHAYTFLVEGERAESLTYADVDRSARVISSCLNSVPKSGERVLLLYPTGLEFVVSFLGCLYSGLTAVLAHPLDTDRLDATVVRVCQIIQDTQPVLALTTTLWLSIIQKMSGDYPMLKSTRWLTAESVADDCAQHWQYPDINADTVAVIHYTSGSTGTPRGVIVSHGNLIRFDRFDQEAFALHRNSSVLTWRRLSYSPGFRSLIKPLIAGSHSILMSAEAFLQKPVRWLEAISRYKVTISGGSNFCYELCVARTRPEECRDLNLQDWEIATISGEPIRPIVLERFATKFAPFGFRREAFSTRYTLSEFGVVSKSPLSRGIKIIRVQKATFQRNKIVVAPPEDISAIDLVSSGELMVQGVVIVDPNTSTASSPGEMGEIWVPNKDAKKGYLNMPGETKQTFEAQLLDTRTGTFLRTGDLGFIHEGELFVTGRLKERIIIRGRTLYPQGIELSLEKCPKLLQQGCAVAFSIQSTTNERLIIIQEALEWHESDLDNIIDIIRKTILEEHEVLVYEVILVRAKSLPRTGSHKIERQSCRAAYIDKSLDVIKSSIVERDYSHYSRAPRSVVPHTRTEKRLEEIVHSILGVNKIGIYESLVESGIDPITAGQCLTRIRDSFNVDLPVGMLLTKTANVRELAAIIDKRRG